MKDVPDQAAEMVNFISLFPEENPCPVLRADAHGVLLYANRAAAMLLQQWRCAVGDVVPEFVLQEITQALQQNQNRELETRCGPREFSFAMVPIVDNSYVNFYGRDVTHSKQVEATLVRSEESLRRSQEIAHLGSWEYDLVNDQLTWSDEAYRIFGLDATKSQTSYEKFTEAIHPEDRDAVTEAYADSISEGRDDYEVEHRIIHISTGQIRYLHEKCEHIRNEQGEIVRSVGMVHDITDRKIKEQEIERLNKDLQGRALELESIIGELEAFNYTIAHDLRKPLTIISGYVQLLQRACASRIDPTSSEYLDKIYETTHHMSDFIDAHLKFTRLTYDTPQVEEVDLSALLRELASEFSMAEPQRHVSFKIAQNLSVRADRALLRLVVENLIGNAWKYSAGTGQAVIECGQVAHNGTTAIFIRDNGCGFDMAEAKRLFLPFHRLSDSDDTTGFGIGLATVQRVIHSHGGTIWAEGVPGQGATFYFTLND